MKTQDISQNIEDTQKKLIVALILLGIERKDFKLVNSRKLEYFLKCRRDLSSKMPHFKDRDFEGQLFQTWEYGWLYGRDFVGFVNDDFIGRLQTWLSRNPDGAQFQSLSFGVVKIQITGNNSFSIKLRKTSMVGKKLCMYDFEQGPDGIYLENRDENQDMISQINLLTLMTELNNEVCNIELHEIDYPHFWIDDLRIYHIIDHPIFEDQYLVYKFNDQREVDEVFVFDSKEETDQFVKLNKLGIN